MNFPFWYCCWDFWRSSPFGAHFVSSGSRLASGFCTIFRHYDFRQLYATRSLSVFHDCQRFAAISYPTGRCSVFNCICFLLCILRLTLFTTLSAHLLGEAFPKLRFRNGICLLIILGHAVGIGILGLSSSWWYIVPIVLLTVCVPWSLLLLDPPEPAPQKQ